MDPDAFPEGYEDEEVSHAPSFFVEATEVIDAITNLQHAIPDQPATFAPACSRIASALDKYQEQPQLLDAHLERIVRGLADLILIQVNQRAAADVTTPLSPIIHKLCKVLYVVTKVRGYKVIVRKLPHEVGHLEDIFHVYLSCRATAPNKWKTRYVLWLWLSLLILNPFDLSSIDSSTINAAEPARKTLTQSMIDAAKLSIAEPGKPRDGAAFFLSRLLTRPDMRDKQLVEFLVWAREALNAPRDPSDSANAFLKVGVALTLAMIFKHGKREELLDKVILVAPALMPSDSTASSTWVTDTTNSPLLRKLSIKLIQRIALTYLKPRVVSWRYKRGNRSLVQNMIEADQSKINKRFAEQQNASAQPSASAPHSSKTTDVQMMDAEDADIDVPEEVEELIGQLLNGLRDKDTIVRWSAAKGLGRVTIRLPMDFADDVVGSLTELFSPHESDSAWHGACLATAELARRGLLLPHRLPAVVPLVLRALVYDIQKGSSSVGTHVRDAACYVCWAFARAYSADIMQPYMRDIARGLLVASVFDREVNCRRAASAAFQENVGRQGNTNFPHGIEILTKADYFTLCNRTTSYLEISIYIAQYKEYSKALIDHLVDYKIQHWEQSLRELTSKALYNLTACEPDYMLQSIIPKLLPLTVSAELNIRHGSLLALAEIMLALSQNAESSINQQQHQDGESTSAKTLFPVELQERLRNVVPDIEQRRLYRGRGGEIMREAVCRFIECMALSRIPLPMFIELQRMPSTVSASRAGPTIKKKAIERFQETLDENLKHPNETIAERAVAALRAFTTTYCTTSTPEAAKEIETKLINKYIQVLGDPNAAARRGYALALGALPKHVIGPHFEKIARRLVEKIEIERDPGLRDAEARRNAVKGLIALCETVGVSELGLKSSNVGWIFEGFLVGTNDYSIDNRGDVGLWVREAAMSAMERLAFIVNATPTNEALFTPSICERLTNALLKQAVEKIDRVRDVAGNALQRLVMSTNPVIQHLPHRDALERTIQQAHQLQVDSNIEDANQSTGGDDIIINWSAPSVTFPLLVPLMQYDVYRHALVSGIVVSIGGLSEHVVRHSGEALVSYLRKTDNVVELKVASTLLQLLMENVENDRVVVPVLKTYERLLANNCFQNVIMTAFAGTNTAVEGPTTSDSTSSSVGYIYGTKLIDCIRVEIRQTREIAKLQASIKVLCELIKFDNPVRQKAFSALMLLLFNRFPTIRKFAGENLYTTIITDEDSVPEDRVDDILAVLADTKWDSSSASDVRSARDKLCEMLGLPKIVATTQPAPTSSNPQRRQESNDSYKDLVKEAGY